MIIEKQTPQSVKIQHRRNFLRILKTNSVLGIFIHKRNDKNMINIFEKLSWEKEHNEIIEIFWDCEGYEQKERQPMGDYGYKIKEGHLYKFITAKGIYFVENGKATLVYSFNERKERSRQVTDYLIKNNYI